MFKTLVATFHTVMGSSLSHQSAVDAITQWASRPAHELIFDSGRREIGQYMQAVARLQQSPPGSSKDFDKLMCIATARLKLEFLEVLKRQADYPAGPASTTATGWSSVADSTACAFRYEEYSAAEPPSDDVISYLKNIAERMNCGGKIGVCVDVYKSVRKPFVLAQLRRLRFDELSLGCNNNNNNNRTKRFTWDEMKARIELWVQVSKICVKILFLREKQLCDKIFGDLGDNCAAKDECFVGTVEDFAVGLFGFLEAISLNNQPFDRLASVLGLYDAFIWVLPDAEALFSSNHASRIRNGILQTWSRIENQVGGMLFDFESTVIHDRRTDASDDRGAVDQCAEYVMRQIGHIVGNKALLANLIRASPALDFGDVIVPRDAVGDDFSIRGSFEQHLVLIIAVLVMNLEKKSNSHANPCLGELFMMNNLRYIVQKIEGSSELKGMIGDPYLIKLSENVQSTMVKYLSLTCSKFLICFQDKGLYISRFFGCFGARPSKTTLKKRLKTFNAVFEEIKASHCLWMVPDLDLRNDVRVTMCEKLVPAYKNFLEKFTNDPKTKVVVEKNAKYSPDDLEALVLENLFEQE